MVRIRSILHRTKSPTGRFWPEGLAVAKNMLVSTISLASTVPQIVAFLVVLAVFFVFATAAFAAGAGGQEGDVATLIVAMERAALDRSDKGDTDGFLEISAPEVTYFDPFLDQPIRGLEALRTYYRGFPSDEQGSGEMLDPRVQVAGDVAVLTFNYIIKFEKSGRVNRWNTTEVYRRTKDGWRIIHTHWSFLKPALAE